MVISRVDRQIIRQVAMVDGIACGLSTIAALAGVSYQQAHTRLKLLESAGLVVVDRRGKGKRLIIKLTGSSVLAMVRGYRARIVPPVSGFVGLQITYHK